MFRGSYNGEAVAVKATFASVGPWQSKQCPNRQWVQVLVLMELTPAVIQSAVREVPGGAFHPHLPVRSL